MKDNIEKFNNKYDFIFKKYKNVNELREKSNKEETNFLYLFDIDYYNQNSEKLPENTCKLGMTCKSINIRLSGYQLNSNIRNIECLQCTFPDKRERLVKSFLKHKTNIEPIAGTEYYTNFNYLIKLIYIILYFINENDIQIAYNYYNNKDEKYNILLNYIFSIYEEIIKDSNYKLLEKITIYNCISDNTNRSDKIIINQNINKKIKARNKVCSYVNISNQITSDESINKDNECYKCFTTFTNKEQYKTHVKNCKINQCKYCYKDFCRRSYLEKHLLICKINKEQQSKNSVLKGKDLESTLLTQSSRIKELEEQLKQKELSYITLEKQLNIKDEEINELKIINKINLQRIEDFKQSKSEVLYNKLKKNIHDSTLIRSPETILNTIDIKIIFQNNNITNEEEFAKYLYNKKLTEYIIFIDKSRNKIKYLDKKSEVVKDINCRSLTTKIYEYSKESAQILINELTEEKNNIIIDKNNSKREINKVLKTINLKIELYSNIIKNDIKSMLKFSRILTKLRKYNNI